MVEITQWPILIALFSQCVPPSCVCYCRTGEYAVQGGDAEPAGFLSPNNLKCCGVEGSIQEERCTLADGTRDKEKCVCVFRGWGERRRRGYNMPDHQVCSLYVEGEHRL